MNKSNSLAGTTGRLNSRGVGAILLLTVCGLSACATDANYQRPSLQLPDSWPAKQGDAGSSQPASHVGERWWTLYADPVLDAMEEEALVHNLDIQAAAARILEVRAQLGLTEADHYPSVSANLQQSRNKTALFGTYSLSHASIDASYEVDLWGRLRNATTAARAQLLATESARDSIRLSLTAQVAQQYFALLSYDAQEIALRRALKGRQERLDLDRRRVGVGVLSEYDLHQSAAEEAAVRSQLIAIVRVREQQEVALSLLLGRSPREVMSRTLERGTPKPIDSWVPEGLPAELLLRRPDLKQAEANLVALNARIAEARAQFFPAISLTGSIGSESTSLSNLFSGPSGIFQFAAGLTQPIFNAGRTRLGVDIAEARRNEAVAQYRQAVASAFADVRNALAAQEAGRQIYAAETMRANALDLAYKQADLRYQGGISSRLELLDVERNFLQAELNRLDAERTQRAAVADLFKALGGGWEQPPTQSNTQQSIEGNK
ncbi:MAG: efflux transporter outer membrane subunit [Pseudomonadota bacterium]